MKSVVLLASLLVATAAFALSACEMEQPVAPQQFAPTSGVDVDVCTGPGTASSALAIVTFACTGRRGALGWGPETISVPYRGGGECNAALARARNACAAALGGACTNVVCN